MEYNNKLKGLTSEQAAQRTARGESNGSFSVSTRSIPRIICDNIFTLFNLVNAILALLVALTGSYRNMLFMGVVICNVAIGIVQEIRSKLAIDRLTLISDPKARVLRDGAETLVDVSDVVKDDILLLSSGCQLCADAVLCEGDCEADESLLTGESDPVHKSIGDTLLSGSFIVSGTGKAAVTAVGVESYANKLTKDVKYEKKPHSEMMLSINKIISFVSVCIVPFALVLFFKAIFVTGQELSLGIVSTVAALIGMIPEGLVLLTSIALAVSSVRLSKKNTLCRELYCIENLARVDVLCLDKTGTLTEGCMQTEQLIALDESFDCTSALNALTSSLTDINPTLAAIKEQYSEGTDMKCTCVTEFSSARKWSCAGFEGFGCVILGAPAFVLDEEKLSAVNDTISSLTAEGKRVLLLAHSYAMPTGDALPEDISAKALIVLSDKIRTSAPDTLRYFAEQDVDIRVISGDDPLTVSGVAGRAGLIGAENFVDASTLSDDDIPAAAEKYKVFGRVTPKQKLLIVKALKSTGHRVAMTGDGVNDVPALKEADCSIAMQSGSDATRNVSQLVLVDSDFASMPLIVAEGRRCINNIRRSASLFLGKTVFSFLLAVLFLLLPFAYPFRPIQMTLINAVAIGIPSFLLTLEPDFRRVKDGFLGSVLRRAFPCGIAVTTGICLLLTQSAHATEEQLSTMAMMLAGTVCLASLYITCRPLDLKRAVMLTVMSAAFVAVCGLFPETFFLVRLEAELWGALAVAVAAALALLLIASVVSHKVHKKHIGTSAPVWLKRTAMALVFAFSATFAVWFGALMADYICLADGNEPLVAEIQSDGSYEGFLYNISEGEIEIFGNHVQPQEIKNGQE